MLYSIITSCAPFTGFRKRLQEVALHSFAQVRDCQVIVLGEDEGVEEICTKYGFTQVKGIQTGKDVGVPGADGIVMSDGFERAKQVVKGRVVCYVNADCVLMPWSYYKIGLLFLEGIRFAAWGRRLNWDKYRPKINDVDDATAFENVQRVYKTGKLKRNGFGIDLYMWSRAVFEDMMMPPFLIDGWSWDIWMGNIIFDLTDRCYRLDGIMEIVHPQHEIGRQTDPGQDLASSEYNYKVLDAVMPGIGKHIRKPPKMRDIYGS